MKEIFMGHERYQDYEMIAKAETETTPVEITWVGRLDGGQPDRELWSGTITAETDALKERFHTDEAGVQSIIENLKESVESYYVPTNPNAQIRCIDGRSEVEEPTSDLPELGPQVAGGTPAATVSYRLAHFEAMPEDATIETDLDEVIRIVKSLDLPFPPGAHDDDNQGVGCGANAKMMRILEKMQDGDAMRDFTKAITEESYDEEIFEKIRADIGTLLGPEYKDQYFMKDPENGEYEYASALLDKTEELGKSEGRKSVEVLKGQHFELLLLINRQKNTTLNRDKLSADNKHLAQVFNYDYWVSVDRAQQLFPQDEPAQKTVIISQAMFGVGTAMTLTDGSIQLGIR